MRKMLALAVAMILVGSVGVANAQDCVCCGTVDACKDKYDKGLEFAFSGLGTLGVSEVVDGTIGIKKALGGCNYAIVRAGLGIDRDKTEGQTGFTDDKQSVTTLAGALGVQHNLGCCGLCIVPYIGGLFGFSYSSIVEEYMVADPTPAGTPTKKTDNTIGVSFNAMVGAEWFFKKCMSLSGEYTFGFGYSSRTITNETQGQSDSETKSSGMNFGPFGTAGLRLTVYFN